MLLEHFIELIRHAFKMTPDPNANVVVVVHGGALDGAVLPVRNHFTYDPMQRRYEITVEGK